MARKQPGMILAIIVVFVCSLFPLSRVMAQYNPGPTQNECGTYGGAGEGCSQSSQCSCSDPKQSATCSGGGTSCTGTCLCTTLLSPTDAALLCYDWSACSGGWQTRECTKGGNPDYQIRSCTPDPTSATGGGGGNTPVPPTATTAPSHGNIVVRGTIVSSSDTSCAAIVASTSYAAGAFYKPNPDVSPLYQQQTGESVTWTSVPAQKAYTLLVNSYPTTYTIANICNKTTSAPSVVQGATATLLQNETLTYYVGFVSAGPWFQVQGANAYAQNLLSTTIPASVTTRYFNLLGADGITSAGIVAHGAATYPVFDTDTAVNQTIISQPNNWVVANQKFSNQQIDLYNLFTRRLASTQTITESAPNWSAPTSGIYRISGDASIDSAVTIPAGQKLIVLVTGNLTVNQNVVINPGSYPTTSGGFIAFIVNGNVLINTAGGGVGPHIQGVYIASHCTAGVCNGTFTTSTGTQQLVMKGIFVADTFSLQRDLGLNNANTPAELFVFDPQLFFTMPDALLDLPYVWQAQ